MTSTELPSGPSIQKGFNGAIIAQERHIPPFVFAFEITFRLDKWPSFLKNVKPPKHFHPHQEEYIEVLEGELCVDVGSQQYTLTPQSGRFCIRPWVNHRLYPPLFPALQRSNDAMISSGGGGIIRFLLSGQDTVETFKLDILFFMNWYGYQEETVVVGNNVDILQVMSMFDAGGSYLSLPEWVPFGSVIAMGMGITLGRWLGSLLGYQPYHRKWTRGSDWDLACNRMGKTLFQRQFAIREKNSD
ncbi:hypothetical protein BO83DRAFT_400825 [Aspergillus eucalypticola CBS 122712]|uniref:Uncharacterized protein n=1 Tax=Aspergillus eucalypticola (strain CBS 122712 / IBT 29274) TaxID=1448314 RepID=A0A317V239_ASPEC|nr:uncharacterized protein BO83DRAFT_400825 [Aspergillus eucalypticola CBS 122712]PWY68374.1 hypothetical protein BO83DRAFT_400825 [Aspergillus eucalypticola CBS 122712]